VSRKRCAGTADLARWLRRPRTIGAVGGLSLRPLTPSALLGTLARFGVRPAALPRRVRLAWTVSASVAIAVVYLLDSAASPFALAPGLPTRDAAVWGVIVTVLQILEGWIATAAEVTAAYVWIALQWLAGVTAALLRSTGAMFARVWDATRIVWSDVLKPALQWLDATLKRYYDWLQKTFRPVFDFLKDVRERLRAFYNTFVRPVTDTIEFIRQVNRVLLTFHIDVLQKLDRVLQQVEQRIDEPFIWINQKLNEITNWLNRIVTLDGLFQRITLIKSLASYAPAWIAGFYNTQIDSAVVAAKTRAIPTTSIAQDPSIPGAQLEAFFRDGSGEYSEAIAALVPYWRQAAGVDPPGTFEG
jgi:hypothetical protein